MMESKKETNGQLQRKIRNSLVFVPKDKYYKSCFFEDKMLRLETTEDNCIITTGYHKHVFEAFNPNQGGYSRPYLYTKRIIDIVDENDCKTDTGTITYERMLDVLKQKEKKNDYNVAMYYSWWLFNIFQPLYQIGESTIDTFLTYEAYLHNIARSTIILGEKGNDITNIQFIKTITEKERSFVNDTDEYVVFKKITDDEMKKQEFKAIQEIDDERILQNKEDESQSQEIK